MLDFSDPLNACFTYLVIGALVAYAGMRVLWHGLGTGGVMRGAGLALPIVAVAIAFTVMGFGGLSIAILCTASVMMLTLGLGVTAAGASSAEGVASPSLRLVAPLAACTFIVGFSGELSIIHAIAIGVVALLALWSAPRPVVSAGTGSQLRSIPLALGIIIALGGAGIIVMAAYVFITRVSNITGTPITVIMAPALLLSVLGLFAHEARRGAGDSAIDATSSFVVTCLGGQALTILLAHLLRTSSMADLIERSTEHVTVPSTTQAQRAVDAVSSVPAIVMPMATWRVDSVLLVVVSTLLIPVGTGHLRLGRIEGFGLIFLYLFYASVAMHAGAR